MTPTQKIQTRKRTVPLRVQIIRRGGGYLLSNSGREGIGFASWTIEISQFALVPEMGWGPCGLSLRKCALSAPREGEGGTGSTGAVFTEGAPASVSRYSSTTVTYQRTRWSEH